MQIILKRCEEYKTEIMKTIKQLGKLQSCLVYQQMAAAN